MGHADQAAAPRPTLTLPGPDAQPWVEAATYVAVLAYPDDTPADERRRVGVIEAAEDLVLRIAPRAERWRGLRLKLRDARTRLNAACRLIVYRRLPAVEIAVLRLHGAANGLGPRQRSRRTWEIPGGAVPGIPTGFRLTLSYPAPGLGRNCEAVARSLDDLRGARTSDLSALNVKRRVWKETLPVLHLAFALGAELDRRGERGLAAEDLVLSPPWGWAERCAANAEGWARLLEQHGVVPHGMLIRLE